MIIHVKTQDPGTVLETEIEILTRDTHSKSGTLIHAGLDIETTRSLGYGMICKVRSKSIDQHRALEIYKELARRCPELLKALQEMAILQRCWLELHFTNAAKETDAQEPSSHSKIEALPYLLSWLSNPSTS